MIDICKNILVLLIVLFACSCKQETVDLEEKKIKRLNEDYLAEICIQGICTVSIIKLIATPAVFHGKKVRVNGVTSIRFEGTAVYIDKESFRYHVSSNALWLDIQKRDLEKLNYMDGKYVIIEGYFDAMETGHMSLFSGSIKSISRLDCFGDTFVRKEK